MLQRVMASAALELANEPPFAIGTLHVEPAHLRVSRGDAAHNVEPRIMQVLVVLGQADGRVISRAELVERCWDGRIVGENAIQRVISHLRGLGKTTAAFEVESVTKVGYLLRPTGRDTPAETPIDETPAEPAIAPSSHRAILVDAATVVAAAGATLDCCFPPGLAPFAATPISPRSPVGSASTPVGRQPEPARTFACSQLYQVPMRKLIGFGLSADARQGHAAFRLSALAAAGRYPSTARLHLAALAFADG